MRGKRRRTASIAADIWATAGSQIVEITAVTKQTVTVMKEIIVRTAVPAMKGAMNSAKIVGCVWSVPWTMEHTAQIAVSAVQQMPVNGVDSVRNVSISVMCVTAASNVQIMTTVRTVVSAVTTESICAMNASDASFVLNCVTHAAGIVLIV